MTLLKLSPTSIVMTRLVALLSSMAMFSLPVQSLETGYVYGPKENPSTADRYKDLKCTYLFAGLTHMRLVKLMLEDANVTTAVAIKVTAYYYKSRAVICTLYDVADVEIGSLWLLHLYVSTAQFYLENYPAGAANEASRRAFGRLADKTGYVADSMQKELLGSGCRPGNIFDTYENWYRLRAADVPSGEPNIHEIQAEALNHCRELDRLLATNNAQSTYGTRYVALKSKTLLLNNLGVNRPALSMLLNTFNEQVNWYGTFKALDKAWHDVHNNMLNKKNGLSTIKKYYTAHFGLFKAIAYRLTWKHLLYVNMSTGSQRIVYLKKWHDWLIYFQKLLRLQDDPDVAGLLVAIDRLAHNDGSIVNIIYQLQDKLYALNEYLHCNATNPMNLDAEEFHSSADQSTFIQLVIEHKSLESAQAFLSYLKLAFQTVDFDLVRSLVTYVDDEAKW